MVLKKLKVNEVKKYLNVINGFKKITITESQANKGLAESTITGVTNVIERHRETIVLADYLGTSKFFWST